MRVLYILWDGGVGGAAANLTDFIRRQNLGRFDVTVCLLSRSGPAVESILGPNVRAVEIRANSGLDMRACLRLIRFLRSNRYDVIHNNAMTYFSHIALMLGAIGTPRLYQEHGDIHTHGDETKARVFYKLFQKNYDIFLTVSDYTRKIILERGVSPPRVVDIGNPIDVNYFRPTFPRADAKRMLGFLGDARVVGTACRFVNQKDLPLFLRTAKAIHSVAPGVVFALVGSGSEEPRLRQLASSLGIESVVRFLGSRTDMATVYRSFDVFLLTSLGESFGRTIFESLASATPIVSVIPAFGGGRKFIEEAEGVLRTEERDSETLAGLTLELLQDPVRLELIGNAGREWVVGQRYFHVDEWVGRLGKIYSHLAERPLNTRNMTPDDNR